MTVLRFLEGLKSSIDDMEVNKAVALANGFESSRLGEVVKAER